MRMGQGVRTGLIGHGGIICVLQTQFSSCFELHKVYTENYLTPSP